MALGKVGGNQLETTLNIDSGTLYVDGTNNRVGVGTSSPEAKLHISTGGGIVPFASSQIVSESTGNNYIELNGGSTSTTAIYFGDSSDQDAGGVLYNHSNDSLSFRANAASRMLIDSAGRVTMPYQPAFYVYNLNFPDSNSAGAASGGSVLVNIGSHYATGTGRFTAPISGTYMFTMMTQAYDSGNTTGLYQTAVFRKNGSNVGGEAYHGWQPNDGNNHVQAQNTIIISLSANDYMQAYVQYGSRDIQNFFSGYLIG